jgi:hypothetical protein
MTHERLKGAFYEYSYKPPKRKMTYLFFIKHLLRHKVLCPESRYYHAPFKELKCCIVSEIGQNNVYGSHMKFK